MFNNESILKSIARRVFPEMGKFSSGGVAKLGTWDVVFSSGRNAAGFTVSCGQDRLFRIEVRGPRVEATYALPAIIELGDGSREFGTEWANSRRWRVEGWSDIPKVSTEIREFFNNYDEYLEEEAKVYKILERAE